MVCETNNGQCSSSSSGNRAGISSGALYKTEPGAKKATGKVKPTATPKEWVLHSYNIAHEAAQLDTNFSEALATYTTATDSCEPYNKLSDGNFIPSVCKIAKGEDTVMEIPQAERNNIKNIVENSYGKDPTTYEETIWKGVKATPLTKANSGRSSDTKLESISTLNNLQQIEAFREASAAIKKTRGAVLVPLNARHKLKQHRHVKVRRKRIAIVAANGRTLIKKESAKLKVRKRE
ncbi:Trypanosome variant surface glycoprotein (A-type) [Trypanosoma brucei equiperdum]|uniref:Trypanosome variant surface glycoprotein (A-type) n=1 Tax=Trypanosoma brucei equiperdum TaxID=630700 RepID=A0A3L6LCI8_9TRYP|nr:Trypanosome variant surface glycoprotein (A-type) [Trypanosoma brucei equiperdum]